MNGRRGRRRFRMRGGLAGFKPRVVAESMDFSVQLQLIAAGAGVALVPDLTVETIPDGVVLRPLTEPIERSLFVAARTPTFSDPGALEIMRRLTDSARRELPQTGRHERI